MEPEIKVQYRYTGTVNVKLIGKYLLPIIILFTVKKKLQCFGMSEHNLNSRMINKKVGLFHRPQCGDVKRTHRNASHPKPNFAI